MDEQRKWLISRRKKYLRIAAVALCFCLLLTSWPDILETLSVLAEGELEEDGTLYVTGFGELPGDVREQTVPVGTTAEELTLPDVLEASVLVPENENPPEGEGTERPSDGEGTEQPPKGEGEGTEQPPEGEGEGTEQPPEGEGEGTEQPPEGEGEGTEQPPEGEGEGTEQPPEETEEEIGAPENGEMLPEGPSEEETETVEEDGAEVEAGEPEPESEEPEAGEESGETEAYTAAVQEYHVEHVFFAKLLEDAALGKVYAAETREETVMIGGVSWQSEPSYDGNMAGSYLFTAILPEGYALAEGVGLPQIAVTVQENDDIVEDGDSNNGIDILVQELLERIEALPTAEEYLAKEPDMESAAYTEAAYEEWMMECAMYAEEALAIKEAYDALTQEQQEQFPEEILARLMAWVELAGQLAEHAAVLADEEMVRAKVTLKLDGEPWNDAEVTLQLQNGSEKYSMDKPASGDGVYSCLVSKGTYLIIVNGASIRYTFSANVSPASGGTYYFVNVTYDRGGADGAVPPSEIYFCGRNERVYNVDTTLPLAKPGCIQIGWSESVNGGIGDVVKTIQVSDNGEIRKTPITLYPVFTPAAVTINAVNCSPNGMTSSESGSYTDTVGESGDYTVTFTPDTGYNVPTDATVQIGGTTLATSEYTYTTSTTKGTLTIPREKITGNVTVTVEAEVKPVTITITLKKDGSEWGGQTLMLKDGSNEYPMEESGNGIYKREVEKGPKYSVYVNGNAIGWAYITSEGGYSRSDKIHYVTVTYQNDGADGIAPTEEIYRCGAKSKNAAVRSYVVDKTLPLTKPGHVQTGWSETSGGSETVTTIQVNDGAGIVRETSIILYPVFEPAAVTINAANCRPDGMNPNESGGYTGTVGESGDYTVTFTPDSGYSVPAGVTVRIGGSTLASSEYTYANGKLKIPRTKITGNVTITANAVQNRTAVTIRLKKNGTAWSGQSVALRSSASGSDVALSGSGGTYKAGCPQDGSAYDILVNGKRVGAFTASKADADSVEERTYEYYTVSYDKGGATGEAPTEETVLKGSTYDVTTDYPLTKPGYIQIGWSKESGGSGEVATGSLTIDGKITLYPVFQKKPEAPPAVSPGDLTPGSADGTIKLPDHIKIDEMEIYTNPDDPSGSKITPNPDGTLPVEPGTTIYIRYPEKTENGVTIPASEPVKVQIPKRPQAPDPVKEEQVTVTDTTITVARPDDGVEYEYVLVEKGDTPDWSSPNTTGHFEGLDPNKEYDLYVRKKADGNNFASESAKTEIRTSVSIKEPEIEGGGAGTGNTVVKPSAPDAGGSTVTFTGTYGGGSTPTGITIGGTTYTPEILGNGKWECTVPVEKIPTDADIKVIFAPRKSTGITVEPKTPDGLTIYADNPANESITTLTGYVQAHVIVKVEYDNLTSDTVTNGAVYTPDKSHNSKGNTYGYTVQADGREESITLTVKSVTAAVQTPDGLMKSRKDGGYTEDEVRAWLPEEVTVTYTGDGGYTAENKNVTVTWNTGSIGADFGAFSGQKTISGTVTLPPWATGGNTISIPVEFVDKTVLTDREMKISIGWTYGEQDVPNPVGSITVADEEPTYTYRYSADGGTTWGTKDILPKSARGHIIPGTYMVEMTYQGKNYAGVKVDSFTVGIKSLMLGKGTLEAVGRKYDGTTNAILNDGQPVLSGVVEGDKVTLGGSLKAVFTGAGPGKNIPVTVTGFRLEGEDAAYYRIGTPTLTLYADITNADDTSASGGSSGSGGGGNSGSNNGSGNNSGSSSGSGSNSGSSGGNGSNSGSSSGDDSGSDSNSGSDSGESGSNNDSSGGNNGSNSGSNGNGSNTGSGISDTSTAGAASSGTTLAAQQSAAGTGGSSGRGSGNGKTGSASGQETSAQTSGTAGQGASSETGTEPGQGAGTGGSDKTGQNSPDSTQNSSARAEIGQWAEYGAVQTVQAAVENGRIVMSGESAGAQGTSGTQGEQGTTDAQGTTGAQEAMGTKGTQGTSEALAAIVTGSLTADSPAVTQLAVGNGSVVVMVVCVDEKYAAGTRDTVAAANAILTPEQVQLAADGGTVEVRIDIKDISGGIPVQDLKVIENGVEAYQQELPGLVEGAYMDISVFVRSDASDWNTIAETGEPVEVVIAVPEELRGEGREYYVIRAHNGGYAMMEDMDDEPDTITIRTDKFSSYAITYRQTAGADAENDAAKCRLCHICPTFLGMCCFIWLAVIAAFIVAVVIIVLRRKKRTEEDWE